ncbi:MAG: 4Fe-4S binding protein [Eubacteriales bacterium]|nr:4Fe-4S binding protein [Eubacteriales bacterium]NCC81158.1 4Fe-4S dicluster domain-containing protein [Clostridia bacterium]NMA67667.1 4Fe-4S binding protein [Clostridiaceae bacterium]
MSEKPIIITLELCKACGICYRLCPTGAIAGNEKGEVVLQHPEKCIKCGMCEDHCPDFAISVWRDEDGK